MYFCENSSAMIIPLLLSLLFSFTSQSYPLEALSHDDPPIIIIIPDGTNNGGGRDMEKTLVNGYIDTIQEVVFLSFLSPLGMVDIRFDNLTNGDYYETTVNGSGSVVIPLSFSSGSWQVTFSLADGTVFSTGFVI